MREGDELKWKKERKDDKGTRMGGGYVGGGGKKERKKKRKKMREGEYPMAIVRDRGIEWEKMVF
jgi:hypothetical protein